MRKKILVPFAMAGILSQGAGAADGGTLHFTGEIVDAPCAIAPGSQHLNVPLGPVTRRAFDEATPGFAAAGKKATSIARFRIELLGCGASAKGATVRFVGRADADDTTSLRLSEPGQQGVAAASGVAVELGAADGTKIALGASSGPYTLGLGDNSLSFQAAYVATRTTVTPGPANAVAQFTVAYK
ncbi:fimbrial protein [Variovorax sp. UMC13]|uniref:fimbrial protein n=1 Tax=Variovorax sp. UMC13 TaxID=1862326 RepID=UPI0015FEFC84|nr:fimbrial protein [Variovorax sp. UMC13]MBB1599751.1 fimbrial protein [Variovorax sp. UMC13]